MSNDFSQETRALNVHHNFCRVCHCNEMCSLHHIISRRHPFTDSPVNSILLCYKCHGRADGYNHGPRGKIKRDKLFREQLRFLISLGYEFTKDDIEFMRYHELDLIKIMNNE